MSSYRNIRLHPFLRLVYLWLRITSWVSTKVYYRRRLVLHPEYFDFDGPAIVISNHPSTLTDVLNTGLCIRQEMFFLANYGLFKHPVSNWILTRFFCIPIKRKDDVAEGEARNNDVYFEQSYRHLNQNGLLFIAPEGYSWMNRFIRPLKTGTARIAFGAAQRSAQPTEIKIITVGLTYSAPDKFRSEIVIQAGPPVWIREWYPAWLEDPEKAVDDLTAFLENRLKELTMHTRDEAGERLISHLETLADNDDPQPQESRFLRSQALVHHFLDNTILQQKTDAYFEALQQYGLTDLGVASAIHPHAKAQTMSDGLRLALAWPLFLLGYGFWFLPCYLPWLLARKLNLYIGYDSNVKILAGLFTFPPAIWVAYRIGMVIYENPCLALIIPAFALSLGLFTERFLDVFRRFRERQKVALWAEKNRELFKKLVEMRMAVRGMME